MLIIAISTQLVLAGSPVGGSPAQTQPSSPMSAYPLQGDFANTGTGTTRFTSSDTSAGQLGAWQFYANGAGEAALRTSCTGAGCWGANLQGKEYGTYSRSNNTSSTLTSIGIYGESQGPAGGQGVAGFNGQPGGYGGVFTATGASGVGMKAYCNQGVGTPTYDCQGAYAEGEAYGIYALSTNTSISNTSIGVYGISSARRGQGVAGESNQALGYGGVFTATGSSGTGIRVSAANGDGAHITSRYTGMVIRAVDGSGAYITSTNNDAIVGVSESGSGIYAVSGQWAAVYGQSGSPTSDPPYSILGGGTVDKTTIGVAGFSGLGHGVYGETRGNNGGESVTAGVSGQNTMYNGGLPIANASVYGTCDLCNGVFGRTNSYVGVRGMAEGPANSYAGYFTATLGTALYGLSASGTALYGYSTSGFGVYGFSTSSYGLSGGSTSGFGVRGASTSNYGMFITTGTGPAAGYVKTTSGLVGLRAVNPDTTASHFAIVSDGNVQVNGTLHATGGIVAVASTDQGNRETYSEQASQHLATDAGTAKLVNGKAIVKIDPLFAQTVDLSSGYRVFAMPKSLDTVGLGVINETATSFTIGELNKGTGNFSFDWKIEAVRKGYEKQRMEAAPVVPRDATPSDVPFPDKNAAAPPLSNTRPPVVPQKPGIIASGELVPRGQVPNASEPGRK